METDRLFASLSLLLLGTFSFLGSFIVLVALYRLSKEKVAFRILFSEALIHTILLVQFGMWPGLLILLGYDPLPLNSRPVVHFLIDVTAFVAYHQLTSVALSRFLAIKVPFWLLEPAFKTYVNLSCALCWLAAVGLSALYQFFSPWYAVVYYDPQIFGFNSENFDISAGFWKWYNAVTLSVPMFLYLLGAYLHMKHSNTVADAGVPNQNATITMERRLIISCAVRTVFFAMASLMYHLFPDGSKWKSWFIMMSLLFRSMIFPLLFVSMGTLIREEVGKLLGFEQNNSHQQAVGIRNERTRAPTAKTG